MGIDLSTQIHFIAGKGGVGKTLISQAIATFFAENKRSTLLVELSEDESEEPFKIAKIKENIVPYLSYIKIFPDQALYEYLSMKIANKKILNSLLAKRLFRALSSAMPGLSDLTRLGKIWFHADRSFAGHQMIFEKIVVDMASSGFVERFLTIAKVVRDVIKIGPAAKEAANIHNYISQPKHAKLHLVSIPQELAMNEAIEIAKRMSMTKDIHLGNLIINRCLELNVEQIAHCDALCKKKNLYSLANILTMIKTRLAEEREEIRRLTEQIPFMTPIIFPEVPFESSDSTIVQKMVARLQRAASQ